ncbi:hypothetical protein ACFQXB_16380 [Plastorhodobacter daqingensis]|uniref:HNH domain-containing protein n=1 Tax=Plastorhodobacter daqingensis TaxID=1387281 RepID=A0ABW2UP40_9RHOB
MSNFRYIRMAGNELGWTRPHGGRMGGEDYLGKEGLAHEDWNFSKDVWVDGRYHLYLRETPAGFDNGLFNFVLGVHARPDPMIIGFVENASFGVSDLPESVVRRRAQELFALNEVRSLGTRYGGKSVAQLSKLLRKEVVDYCVSLAPQDLYILAQPVPMPSDIYKVTTPRFLPLKMTKEQYIALKGRVLLPDTVSSVEQEEEPSFPEGFLIERLHRSRERSRVVVKQAKEQFIHKHGRLFCEACDFEPAEYFGSEMLRDRIIEAHHDVGLANPEHCVKTKPSDLKMVCPTCHRAIHTIRPWLKVDQLRALLGIDE